MLIEENSKVLNNEHFNYFFFIRLNKPLQKNEQEMKQKK